MNETNTPPTVSINRHIYHIWQITESQIQLVLSLSSAINKFDRKHGREMGNRSVWHSNYIERSDLEAIESYLKNLGLTTYKSPEFLAVQEAKKKDKKAKTTYNWITLPNKNRLYTNGYVRVEVSPTDTGNYCSITYELKVPGVKNLISIERLYQYEKVNLTLLAAMSHAEKEAKRIITEYEAKIKTELEIMLNSSFGEY